MLKADDVFTAPCDSSVLYPASGGNIHEFTAITPCAVLDVLGPPYSREDGRDCSYYKDSPYTALPSKHRVNIKKHIINLFSFEYLYHQKKSFDIYRLMIKYKQLNINFKYK